MAASRTVQPDRNIMENPDVIGRDEYAATGDISPNELNGLDSRASTTLARSVSIPFEAGAIGELNISKFVSTDTEDRGGVVLRITMNNDTGSFFPYAVNIDNGVELHIAGAAEATSLMDALKAITRISE